jgi:hypothetical protein
MQQMEALRRTVALSVERQDRAAQDRLPASLQTDHLVSMIERAHPAFSGEKLGRWLGWAQCSLVAQGAADLEAMKEMNADLDGDDMDPELVKLIDLATKVVKGLADADTNHGGLINTDLLSTANSLRLHLSKFPKP